MELKASHVNSFTAVLGVMGLDGLQGKMTWDVLSYGNSHFFEFRVTIDETPFMLFSLPLNNFSLSLSLSTFFVFRPNPKRTWLVFNHCHSHASTPGSLTLLSSERLSSGKMVYINFLLPIGWEQILLIQYIKLIRPLNRSSLKTRCHFL